MGISRARPQAPSPARSRSHPLTRRLALAAVALVALAAGSLVASPAVHGATPRVVIIVGPAGSLTPQYRALAAEGAAAARASGAQVVEVISPNATWPAARAALQGASIVIYIGHGNGFPSRYSTTLNPQTQDGLGLNPVAGVDDLAHQYYGEAYLAREVRLAPNAVVLLHRLCYASGNTEQGLPEGTFADSRARADNFAAGFLAAGAGAVVADAFASPGYYVQSILAHDRSIEAIWRSSPTFNGHVMTMSSKRTNGATELLDPAEPSSGFYRSLVGRLDISGSDVRAGGRGGGDLSAIPGPQPGPTLDALRLEGIPVAAAQVQLHLGVPKNVAAPAELGVASRWTLLESAPEPAGPAPSSASPNASPARHPSPAPRASPVIWSSGLPAVIAVEEPSAIVVAADAKKDADGFRVALTAPQRPGFYRLTISLLDESGVPYDAETQAAIPALLVHVSAPLAGAIEAPDRSNLAPGKPYGIEIAVTNTGSTPWAQAGGTGAQGDPAFVELVGRWTALGTDGSAPDTVQAWFLAPAPGASTSAVLTGSAPKVAGDYLLTLDLVTPGQGSLTFAGALEPVVIRVSVR